MRYTMADLIHEVTGEDPNGMSPRQYLQAMKYCFDMMHYTERDRYYATGELPKHILNLW